MRHGVYQHKLILQTLAYHIKRIQLSANQIKDYPCNALALATTAVRFCTPQTDVSELMFSQGRTRFAGLGNWRVQEAARQTGQIFRQELGQVCE